MQNEEPSLEAQALYYWRNGVDLRVARERGDFFGDELAEIQDLAEFTRWPRLRRTAQRHVYAVVHGEVAA